LPQSGFRFTNRSRFRMQAQGMRRPFIHLVPYLLLAILPAAARAQVYYAQPVTPPLVVVAQPQQMRSNLGGGFIEFLFGDDQRPVAISPYAAPVPQIVQSPPAPPLYASVPQRVDPMLEQQRADLPMDPQFLPADVLYRGNEPPGTIIVDTPNHFLYLIEEGGRARRYGIGVGRPGFTWSGEHKISAKKEWPDWVPPEEMLQRQPYLPHFMPGGPNNPLGARAMYLGNTLYRIHGSNEPWTIGHNVSSGCIRMRNVDVIDLYNRVKVGTKVVVL
jgi:lipoprotein-anchoring transpeptidase ErfK/SrfK